MPSVSASVGVQGIGTGNPGYSLTMEQNFNFDDTSINVFAGIGLRSNESHGHPLWGVKAGIAPNLHLGVQHDGHAAHPFVTYAFQEWVAGFYLIEGKSAAWLIGIRF